MSARARLTRIAAGACALSIAVFALFSSDMTYPLVAEALALPETTSVTQSHDSVALVVTGTRRDLLRFALVAHEDGLRASIATSDELALPDVARLRAAHLDPLPELRAKGVGSWFAARKQLKIQIAGYRLRGRFYYLAPSEGFTLVDYLRLAKFVCPVSHITQLQVHEAQMVVCLVHTRVELYRRA